jgi:hypothetical protein
MRERKSNLDLSQCFFMANYGINCEKEGCVARKIRRDYLASARNKLSQEERDKMREEVEAAAKEAGCPYFRDKEENHA